MADNRGGYCPRCTCGAGGGGVGREGGRPAAVRESPGESSRSRLIRRVANESLTSRGEVSGA